MSQTFWTPPSGSGEPRGDLTHAIVRLPVAEKMNVLVTRPSPPAS